MIDHSYRKPLSSLTPGVFSDLKTDLPPKECHQCTTNESHGISSYRNMFNGRAKDNLGIQFVDMRNSNRCNLKCRTCDPINSHLIAQERGIAIPLQEYDISQIESLLIQPSLQWLYYTGGEPFINPYHYDFLEKIIDNCFSKNIKLVYNTNLSTLYYKDRDLTSLWKQFSSVTINASIDAIGEKISYIRSGADWKKIKKNYDILKNLQQQEKKISVEVATTISILNFWWIPELLEYFKNDTVKLHDVGYPEYLSLRVIPNELKDHAMLIVQQIRQLGYDKNFCVQLEEKIINNNYTHLLKDLMMQTLLLDRKRGENLFDLLPLKNYVWNLL
jgi:MoaA/NifB/PqqE/SkfB family radical SAM enzyme